MGDQIVIVFLRHLPSVLGRQKLQIQCLIKGEVLFGHMVAQDVVLIRRGTVVHIDRRRLLRPVSLFLQYVVEPDAAGGIHFHPSRLCFPGRESLGPAASGIIHHLIVAVGIRFLQELPQLALLLLLAV